MKRKFNKEHKDWRAFIIARDDNQCVVCGKTGKYLNVHHIVPSMFHEWEFEHNNGITLCVTCHTFGKFSAHKNPLAFTEWLKNNRPKAYERALGRLEKYEKLKNEI